MPRLRFFRVAALLAALPAAASLHAATYYLNNNDSTAGFGTYLGQSRC